MQQQVNITIEVNASIDGTALRARIADAMKSAFGTDCVISVKEEAEIYGNEADPMGLCP